MLMKRIYGAEIIKKFIGAALILLCATVIGLLFYSFGGVHYQSGGANGTLTGVDLSFSIVFSIFFALFYFVCGLCATPGALGGLTVLSVFLIGTGIAGYAGYAVLLGPVKELYFLLLAPIVPILEAVSQIPFLSANSDLLFVLIPAVLAALKLASFCVGYQIHRRPELVKRSLRRIDRFYEYRRPLEEIQEMDAKSA